MNEIFIKIGAGILQMVACSASREHTWVCTERIQVSFMHYIRSIVWISPRSLEMLYITNGRARAFSYM